MKYSELREINVNEHTEKKGNLTYLSWAWALDFLLQKDETATWEYRFFGPPDDLRPYCWIGENAMVFCTVNAFGRSRTAQLPVLDYKNKPISKPNSFDINTTMMRSLAKAISLHGIGLYIYAGEDLPESEAEHLAKMNSNPSNVELDAPTRERLDRLAPDIDELAAKGDVEGALSVASTFVDKGVENYNEQRTYLNNKLDSKTRTAFMKHRKEKADGVS